MELSILPRIEINNFGIEALPHSLGNLTSLEVLIINRCEWLQHLDFSDAMCKLRHLWINSCPLLEAISDGIDNIVLLEKLALWNCKKLQHLPFRDAMWCLTKLMNLQIRHYPLLEESCTNRNGLNSQWSNISHIPNIYLDGIIVQELNQ